VVTPKIIIISLMDRMPYYIGGTLGLILLIVVVQAFLPEGPLAVPPPPVQSETCIGDPIVVSYDFGGTFMEPHECIVQCADNKPRYILYKNGQATQCETPPGCNDYGEDRGVTCEVP